MNKILITILFLSVLWEGTALSQERTENPPRPAPPSRGVETPQVQEPQDRTRRPAQSELPSIELPEFVITGTLTLEPPDIQKEELDGQSIFSTEHISSAIGSRESSTSLGRFESRPIVPDSEGEAMSGRFAVSIGTFFTPEIQASFGERFVAYDYFVRGHYGRTTGFGSNTERSEGSATAGGSILLRSSEGWLDEARLSGTLGYSARAYRFYGSSASSLQRKLSDILLSTGLASAIASPWHYDIGFGYRSTSVSDSSLQAGENRLDLRGGLDFDTPMGAVESALKASLATRSAVTEQNLHRIEVAVMSPRIWWQSLYGQAGLSYVYARGMGGQRSSRVYPKLLIGYQLAERHRISVAYHPDLEFRTLQSLLSWNPYLSSEAVIQHEEIRLRLKGMWEAIWSDGFESKLSVEWKRSQGYPLLTDTTRMGIWDLAYPGSTTIWSVRAEGFANLTSIDYFAVAVTVQRAENSVTGDNVPYVPEGEASLYLSHRFPYDITVVPRFSYVHRRSVAIDNAQTLPGYFVAGLKIEYSGISRLGLFLDLHNILDKQYEVWRGYRATPFQATVGASYRW